MCAVVARFSISVAGLDEFNGISTGGLWILQEIRVCGECDVKYNFKTLQVVFQGRG